MLKNKNGFSAVEILIVFVIVGLIGLLGFFVYRNKNNKTDRSQQASVISNTPSTKNITDTRSNSTKEDPNKGYLVIKQWGVRLKKSSLTSDPEYVIKDDHTLYLTTTTYVKKIGDGSCKANSSTGSLIRGKAGYDVNGSGSKIEKYSYEFTNKSGNTEKISSVKVGDYYYLWQNPQAPCAKPTDANVKVMDAYQAALSDFAHSVVALAK